MQVKVVVGDVLTVPADVLISTANPWLNLSGGVNGAIREVVGPELQAELHDLLSQRGLAALPAGTVVRSNAYSLPFNHILHVVAIDPFYDSSVDLVSSAFASALGMSSEFGALTVSSPTLATGYGPMSIAEFGNAIAPILGDPGLVRMSLNLVVRREEHARELCAVLSKAGVQVAS